MTITAEKENIVDVSANEKAQDGNQPDRIEVPPTISVRDLADKMSISPIELIKVLMSNGIMANINQQIDFDTVSIIGEDMGYEVVVPQVEELEEVEEHGVQQTPEPATSRPWSIPAWVL